MSFETIDLSLLPPPSVVEPLSYEEILASMIADLQARDATFSAMVESDPAYKILEVSAYREFLLRQRVNDAARAVLLAYAVGSDLEQIGALFGVTRKTLEPGDVDAIPPVLPTLEDDDSLRRRIQLSLEGLSTAGPVGAYQFHALKVETVVDVAVAGPPDVDPGEVRVTILSAATPTGAATSDEIAAVLVELNKEEVRPLTDHVTVQSATIQDYAITAVLHIDTGPDSALILTQATARAEAYAAARRKIGASVYLSGIYAALQVPGVKFVELTAPSDDVDIDSVTSSRCTAFNLTATTS